MIVMDRKGTYERRWVLGCKQSMLRQLWPPDMKVYVPDCRNTILISLQAEF